MVTAAIIEDFRAAIARLGPYLEAERGPRGTAERCHPSPSPKIIRTELEQAPRLDVVNNLAPVEEIR